MSKPEYPSSWDCPSVTEILGVIAKPGLMYWLKNRTAQEIDAEQKKSLSIGTQVHEILGNILNGEKIKAETEYPKELMSAISSFMRWKDEQKVNKVIAQELQLKSELGYKGTLDHILECDGKTILIDWKTSKAIYPEYKLQVIAYKYLYLLNKPGSMIDECWIVRLSKENAEVEICKIEEDHEDLFAVFMSALEVYNWIKLQNKGDKK